MSRQEDNDRSSPTFLFGQVGEGGERTGFLSSATAHESGADAAKIVRELIQNSQDAAKESGRARTEIKFEVETVSSTDCPGMDRIKTAFYCALETQKKLAGGKLPDGAQHVADRIKEALQKERFQLLCVSDNGTGLTDKTMKNILGDGQSGKTGGTGGSYGYGHLTVIPASDLRLVYYGGIKEGDDARVASGHCILASFEDNTGIARAKDGYLAMELKADMFDPYVFPTDGRIPDLIASKLERIKEEWGSGTVVLVPAFNFFGDSPDDLWQSIRTAAATNFFVSFFNDELSVEFISGGEARKLDSTSIEETLEGCKSQKRSKFTAGSIAWEFFGVLSSGESITFDTDLGPVSGKLKRHRTGQGMQRIGLCRNGMCITHSGKPSLLPRLQKSAFDGYQPFLLILMLRSKDGEIHELVRASEPPLHDELDIKRLPPSDGAKLQKALDSIKEQLKDRLDKVDEESFQMEGILSLPIGGLGSGGEAGTHAGEWEVFNRQPRSAREDRAGVEIGEEGGPEPGDRGGEVDNPGGGGGGGGGRRTTRKPGNPALFKAIPMMTAPGKCKLEIVADEDAPMVEIRFLLDESMDATCQDMDKEPLVTIRHAQLDGSPVADEMCVKDEDGNIQGLNIADFVTDRRYRLDFEFDPPTDVPMSSVDTLALKAEVVRRKPAQGC